MIVLDTNVVSELMRPKPDEQVRQWFAVLPSSRLFTTTVTQAEILYGLRLLPAGRRRAALEEAAEQMFAEDFTGRILSFDSAAAHAFAAISADRRQAGRPISQFDALIAAVAGSRGAAVATRNAADFDGCGVVVFDPWEMARS